MLGLCSMRLPTPLLLVSGSDYAAGIQCTSISAEVKNSSFTTNLFAGIEVDFAAGRSTRLTARLTGVT